LTRSGRARRAKERADARRAHERQDALQRAGIGLKAGSPVREERDPGRAVARLLRERSSEIERDVAGTTELGELLDVKEPFYDEEAVLAKDIHSIVC
jgi:hypothetical protein